MTPGGFEEIHRPRGRRWLLCLSGGGYRGLFTARVLAQLESEIGAPLHRAFDLVAGTSIGSILALGVAFGTPVEQLVALFEQHGRDIFPKRTLARAVGSLVRPRYATETLESLLAGKFDAKGFDRLKTLALVPAVNLTEARHHVFRSANGSAPASTCSLVDAALASAAAPTYFLPRIVDDVMYADGGLIANKPDTLAVIEALSVLRWDRLDVQVLSIGATAPLAGLPTSASPRRWGIVGWMWGAKLIEQMMSAQATLALDSARTLVPDQVVEIDVEQSQAQSEVVGLDRASPEATKTLNGLAESAWSRFIASPRGAQVVEELRRRANR